MAIQKFGKGDTKNITLEQHEAARKEAKARKQRGHGNNGNKPNTDTSTPPQSLVFRVTKIEDIILKLETEKKEEDRKALKRAEQIRKSGTRSLTLEDLAALKRAAEINAEAKAEAEAAAKAEAEANAAAKAKADAEAEKGRRKQERNQRVQARKAEKAKALEGGGIDFTNIFGI